MGEQKRHQQRQELEAKAVGGRDQAYREMDKPKVRRLTPDELDALRQDMAEASAWARTELKRRRRSGECLDSK